MSGLSAALWRLESIVGEENLLTETQAVSEYRLEGQQPVAVAMPGSAQEAAALLRAASEEKLSVLVRGAGKHLHLGSPPGPIGVVVSMGRLGRIVEYDADDLTVTAQAGMSLGELQEVVGKQGQMLALDPPGPESATLGGIAATSLSGPMRMRYGTPRDLVLGLRVALTDGYVVKTGGKTVKNVAGYELNKLFVGSLGTLGVICELTLRLAPLPEGRAMVMAALSPSEAEEATARLVGSRLELTSLEVANHAACERMLGTLPVTVAPDCCVIFLGLMGDRETVARQEREARDLLAGGCARVDGEEADGIWRLLREAAYPSAQGAVVVRVSVPVARVGETVRMVSSWEGWWVVARAGEGVVYAGPAEEGDSSEIRERLAQLRRNAEEGGGFAILESGPVELKREFPVWGAETANVDLMRGLKESFDPAGIMGCGRFVPGL